MHLFFLVIVYLAHCVYLTSYNCISVPNTSPGSPNTHKPPLRGTRACRSGNADWARAQIGLSTRYNHHFSAPRVAANENSSCDQLFGASMPHSFQEGEHASEARSAPRRREANLKSLTNESKACFGKTDDDVKAWLRQAKARNLNTVYSFYQLLS